MESLTHIIVFVFGFGAGLLVWNRTVRWTVAVWSAYRERRASGLGFAIPSVLFLHSGPWLLGLAIFFTAHILSSPHSPEWNWFFAGPLVVPPVIGVLVFRVLRHQKKVRDEGDAADVAGSDSPQRPDAQGPALFRFMRWSTSTLRNCVVLFGFVVAIPDSIFFWTDSYCEGRLTIAFALISASISWAGGAVCGVLIWYTIMKPLRARLDQARRLRP